MTDVWVGDEKIVNSLEDVGPGGYGEDIPTESQALGINSGTGNNNDNT